MIKTKQIFSILIVGLLSFYQIVMAQTPSWKWVKWSNGTQTSVRSACADASGNLYASGTFNTSTIFDTATLSSTGDAGFVVKYTTAGTYVWSRKIKNPGFAATDCKSIAIDPVGNVYICGAFTGTIELDNKTLTGGGHYLAKYDNNGVIQWAVKTGGSNGVIANSNGIYVAGGSIVEKYDAAGANKWTLSGVKSNQGYTNFFSVALNSAGNLIVAGDVDDNWTYGAKSVIGGYQNIILMEVADAGTVNWVKVLGSSSNGADHVQHMTVDGNNNIIMTGGVGGPTTFNAVNIAAKNGYLLKLDAKGTAKWGTAMSNINTIYGTGGIFVAADNAGSVYVTGGYGTADVTDGGSTIYTKAIKNGGNAFVFKFDSTGAFKTALVNAENPIINNSRGNALAASSAGVYFAGVCAPSSTWGTLTVTGYGSVFAKIDGNTTSSIQTVNSENDILVYPNPSKGKFNVSYLNKSIATIGGTINIVNLLGETVYFSDGMNESTTIDIGYCKQGIYFLQIRTTEGAITKKLMVE